VRTLIGLALVVALFLFGLSVLQSVVQRLGYYDHFTYERAVLGFLLVLACVIAAQLTALRTPKEKEKDKE